MGSEGDYSPRKKQHVSDKTGTQALSHLESWQMGNCRMYQTRREHKQSKTLNSCGGWVVATQDQDEKTNSQKSKLMRRMGDRTQSEEECMRQDENTVRYLAVCSGKLVTKIGKRKVQECPSHKPQPFPDTKRKRKPTNPDKHKSNKRTKCTKISSLFPKRGNRNAKRTEKHKNKMTQGKK